MPIRPFRRADAGALAALGARCARGETDFVLNPLWETEAELFAEFGRFGIEPEQHVWVAEGADGVTGLVGYLRQPGANTAGMLCPIVAHEARGQGVGGELLREALRRGAAELGIELATAAVGTRNRAGFALLVAHGFRPVRQVYVMRCEGAPKTTALAEQQIAPGGPDDAAEILPVYTSCGFPARDEAAMRGVFEDGRHAHWVARDAAGAVAAFVELETHWPERPWVAYVGVRPELRDRGLGSSLVGLALERQFERGGRAALLALSPANRTAVRAYEKVGFRRHRLLDVLERSLEHGP